MALTVLEAVFLAVVQGLTEWLPVSSSGHLALSYMLLGEEPPFLFTLTLHIGTLIAVVVALWDDVLGVIRGLPIALKKLFTLQPLPTPEENMEARMAYMVTLGTIPGAIGGFLLKHLAEESFTHPVALGVFFIFTGMVLVSTHFVDRKTSAGAGKGGGENIKQTVSLMDALAMGMAQILAVFPGISRSGITISAGLHMHMSRENAARLSFLLSIPLIAGATVYETVTSPPGNGEITTLVVGGFVASIVGYGSIKLLFRIVGRGALKYFAPYCLAVGAVLLWLYL